MIAVVKCYKHDIKPLVVETFEEHDEQTQKDANELAAILSRKKNVRIKYSLIFLVLLLRNKSNNKIR